MSTFRSWFFFLGSEPSIVRFSIVATVVSSNTLIDRLVVSSVSEVVSEALILYVPSLSIFSVVEKVQ